MLSFLVQHEYMFFPVLFVPDTIAAALQESLELTM